MSACRLVATIVSKLFGWSVMRTVIASTSILSHVTSGNSLATSAAISSQSSMPWRCAFDLVTTVSCLRGATSGHLKGVAHDARDAGARVNRHLGADLFRVPAMGAAAVAGVFALGVLSNDDPVQVTRPAVAQRRADPREDPGWGVRSRTDRNPGKC